jgi:predicted oxidoreductase
MPHFNHAEFETLWQNLKSRPVIRRAEATPIQADLSLTGILNHYMAMASQQREWGKLTQPDYNDLDAAVNALKAVLVRIDDRALVAAAAEQNAAAIQRKFAKPII